MRLAELMVEHGMEVRASRLVESKRLNGGGFSQEDGLACGRTVKCSLWNYGFALVGFEPRQAPTAMKPAYYVRFAVPY